MKQGKATRDAFGEALAKLGETHEDIVVLDGDVHNSTRTEYFAKKFPDRFFNVGIAESNLVSAAGGMAGADKKPWLASFAAFVMCNAYDQLRMSIAFPNADVKVVGTHAGISIGEDGPSQMGIEDIALACSLPNFTVIVTADEPSTHKAVEALSRHEGPAYLRVGRAKVPIVYENGGDFEIGKANQVREGDDVTIIANGLMVAAALEAAEELASKDIQARVLDMHTVKPLDDEAVLKAAKQTGNIVVAEEHLLHGGLGSAVAMSVAHQHPVPMRFVGIKDTFAESGPGDALLEKYGLTSKEIVQAVRELL